MHKLFYLSFIRTLQRLGTSQFNLRQIDQILTNNKIINSGQDMLYRLPRQQLRHIANITCPINSLEQNNADQIIRASKHIRNHCKIDQKKICYKCPFVANCSVAKKQLIQYKYDNTLKDLLIYFHGLQNFMNPQAYYYRQWVSAYKLGDSVIAAIDDLSMGGPQIKEYQRIRLLSIQQYKLRATKQTTQQKAQKQQKLKKSKVKKLQEILQKRQNVQTSQSKEVNKEKPDSGQTPKIKQVFGRDFSFDQQQQFEPKQKFTKQSIQQSNNTSKSSQVKQPKKNRQQRRRQQRLQQQNQPDIRQQRPKLRKIQIQNTKSDNFDNRPPKRQKMSNYYGSSRDVQQRLNRSNQKYNNRQYSQQKNYKSNNKYSQRQQYDRRPKNNNYKNKYNDRQQNQYQNRSNNRYNDKRDQSGKFNKRFDNNRFNDQENNYNSKYNKSNKYNRRDQGQQDQYNPKIKQRGGKSDFVNKNSGNKSNFIKNDEKSPFVMKWNDQNSDNFIRKGPKNAYDQSYETNQYPSSRKINKSFDNQGPSIKKSKAQPKMVDFQKIEQQPQAPRAGRRVNRRRTSTNNDDDL